MQTAQLKWPSGTVRGQDVSAAHSKGESGRGLEVRRAPFRVADAAERPSFER